MRQKKNTENSAEWADWRRKQTASKVALKAINCWRNNVIACIVVGVGRMCWSDNVVTWVGLLYAMWYRQAIGQMQLRMRSTEHWYDDDMTWSPVVWNINDASFYFYHSKPTICKCANFFYIHLPVSDGFKDSSLTKSGTSLNLIFEIRYISTSHTW